MSDGTRLALVVGALLVVPALVILLVAGTDDERVFRADDPVPPPVAASPTPSPAPSRSASRAPVTVAVEPTELPALDGDCDSAALLDEVARQRAFRDGLDAESDGVAPSAPTETWLGRLAGDLDRCAATLGQEHAGLRDAMGRTAGAVAAYRDALATPDDNSVTAAWSDLDAAIGDVIARWSAVTP